jgi:hypothetical protein
MDLLKWLPQDTPRRLSAVVLPLCVVASQKVQAADQQQQQAGSCEPVEAIMPHDAVVSSALIRIKDALEADPHAQQPAGERELVCASVVEVACGALDNYRTPPRFLAGPCSLPCMQWFAAWGCTGWAATLASAYLKRACCFGAGRSLGVSDKPSGAA